MSWLGLRHKGIEVLFPDEWNRVVDGLDILKQYVDSKVGVNDLTNISSDVAPSADNEYNLGEDDRRWKTVYAHSGDYADSLTVQGKPVLKDGDPVTVMYFAGPAKDEIDQIYMNTLRPGSIQTLVRSVGTTPIPLAEVDTLVRRIHVKVPRLSVYFIYLGSEDKQDYILEPGDIDVFELANPSKIYVRSLGNAEIRIALEE